MTTKNNIPAGYKDSAVGVIPQEWEVNRLVDLCQNTGDYGINAPSVPYREDLPTYLRITDIDGWGKFIETDKVSVDNPNSLQFILREGDIVFARTGATVGKTYLYDSKDGQLVFAGFLIRFTPNSNKAIPYYIKTCTETAAYWNWIRVISQRSGQPGINSVEYGAMKLAVPPMEEQRKIAKILGVWDEAIEKQSRLIEKLELRKRALMQRLLTGRTRLPGFNTPWQKVKLGEIGNFDKGAGVPKEKIVSEGCKAITYGEIYTKYDYVIKDFASYIDSDTAQTSKQISTGAILFAGSGETLEDIGKCVAFIDNDKAYAGGDIIIFNPSIEVDSLVLSYILNSPVAIAQKRRYGQGHSVVHIYQKDLARIEFELPSLPEQKAIAEVLTTAGKEIATHRKKLDALRLQKRGLMQQLLTGKTRIKI